VEIVSVDEPPAVTDVGLNVALAPLGRPLADNDTVWAEPEVTAVETVVDVPEPAVTVPDVGLTEIEKSFVGGVEVQLGSVNEFRCVRQLNVPFEGMYSCAYQNVQPSTGSTTIDE
jgi:hypothetical protein